MKSRNEQGKGCLDRRLTARLNPLSRNFPLIKKLSINCPHRYSMAPAVGETWGTESVYQSVAEWPA